MVPLRTVMIGRHLLKHSHDCRTLRVDDKEYEFTPAQAAIVRELIKAAEHGTPSVGQETLLEAAGLRAKRLVDVFKRNSAWKVLIGPGRTNGSFRLNLGT